MTEKKMDYSRTVNLPRTDFPMKAELPKREPEILKFWEEQGIYGKLLQKNEGRPSYVLHDGPPYANGHIHIGHALNKILKDVVVKSKAMSGHKAPYRPGWDCHGLPIEQQLMKELKMEKRGVRDVASFRQKARAFAEKFITIQKEEFVRLGILGEWEHPYTTMEPAYEAEVIASFRKLASQGYIYRGKKPVYWCFSCETALAEAEVEYKTKTSPSIYVKFPLKSNCPIAFPAGKSPAVLIWTTTPWTLPANVALAFHPKLDYSLVRLRLPRSEREELLILSQKRIESVLRELGVESFQVLSQAPGTRFEDIWCRSPLGFRDSKGVLAEYVSSEEGTGIVHTAPGHGQEDYEVSRKYQLPVLSPVDERGVFTAEAGPFSGRPLF